MVGWITKLKVRSFSLSYTFYLAQFKDPSFHSWRSPIIKIKVNRVVLIRRIDNFVVNVRIGIGINSTISMSNTIKIIASKKKRIENGIRALWLGSNPHSKGDDFSRLEIERIEVIQAIKNTINGRIIAIDEDVIRSIIN